MTVMNYFNTINYLLVNTYSQRIELNDITVIYSNNALHLYKDSRKNYKIIISGYDFSCDKFNMVKYGLEKTINKK